ncbi:MAG: Gldg family protein [Akkermansiaceae bacterium]|nr:Gldg family protein [Akkermansiaceae bacterium]
MKTTRPMTRAALGVAALVVITLLANWLVLLSPQASRGIDFTENNIYTLTDGTKAILEELDTPVVIRYYASRDSDLMREETKLHMRRLDDLLQEYENHSEGMLRVEHYDPEPDTEEEDLALLDGITGIHFNEQNLYYGIAISSLDKTATLELLEPRGLWPMIEETMLEYQISSRIAAVSTSEKPVIGILSGIDLKGNMDQPVLGQRPSPPWVIYEELQQAYRVVDLPLGTTEIDPDEIKTLIVFHPAGITPATEYAIDQYLLRGGTVIACLDAYSITAQILGGGNPQMMGSMPTTSTLPKLLDAWGVEFESGLVLADPNYKTVFGPDRVGYAVLDLPNEAMPQKDSVVTRDLPSVMLYLPGGIHRKGNSKLGYQSLMRSSKKAGFVDSIKAANLEIDADDVTPANKRQDLMVHLFGEFPTAFPAGAPEGASDGEEPLKQATATGNVFVITDIDVFYDMFAYRLQEMAGRRIATPRNGNSSLLLNLVEHSVGSKHLIGSRSRASTRRPFTRIKEMEDAIEEDVREREAKLIAKQEADLQRLNELRVRESRGNQPLLNPEELAELQRLQDERVKTARQIRELRKDLQRRKDELQGRIILLNVGVMPALVLLVGISLLIQRRISTGAR